MTLPTGTVTFLRSDIEGSMEHARALGARYDELNAEHAVIVRGAIAANAGEVVRTEGDAFFAVFTEAGAAARAAVDVQLGLARHDWPTGHEIRVRIGLHTGSAVRAGNDYGGFEVSRAARIADVGHGGQIVVSETARALIALDPPNDAELLDLGRHRLRGIPDPEHLYQLAAPGLERHFDRLRTGGSREGDLPDRHTSFVGRDADLDSLGALLVETRLLTLVGPGGTGKTTLAIELARRHAAAYADGARLVDLQTVTDAAHVRAEIARRLGLFDGPTGPAAERLLPFIAERELLIVVDNLEQVIEASDVLAEILQTSSATRIIATSRSPLRIAAEQTYPVRPLGLATADEEMPDAMRLFLDRARKVQPGLTPRDHEVEAIDDICRLVDGLPLAIELCAARVGVLPIERIRERLSQRLPLPGSGPRDLPARQRTIDDTVAWSLELLEAPLRELFVSLGVFSGSFELQQAEEICGDEHGSTDVLDGLVRLVEHSLLVRMDDPVGGVRFGMLETIRVAARTRLDASDRADELLTRHAEAYIRLAESIFPTHHEPIIASWLDRLEADDDNLRQATRWAIDTGATEQALGLVGYLWKYWVHGGRLAEGQQLTDRALELPADDAPSEARVWAIAAAGSLAYWSNDLERARACYEEQLAGATRCGYRLAEANAWFSLIFVRRTAGDMLGADEAASKARHILAELGATDALEDVDAALAVTSAPAVLADPERLLPVLAEQVERLERAKSPATRAALPAIQSSYYLASGEHAPAATAILESLRAGLAWRMVGDVITSLSFVAALSVHRLEPGVSATILGAVETATQRYGVSGPPWVDLLPDFISADPRGALAAKMGDDELERAMERGRRMSLEEAVDYFAVYAPTFGSP